MGYLIGLLISSLVFGFITRYIAQSKGYDGGFWWGFFLGIIGVLVVGFRPDNRTSAASSAEMPAWAREPASLPTASGRAPGWTCICGSRNPSSIDYCLACRRSKAEAMTPKVNCPHCGASNRASNTLCFACKKPLDGSDPAAEKSSESAAPGEPKEAAAFVPLLEQLAKLHDQGILTDEEFQQKKADLLARM